MASELNASIPIVREDRTMEQYFRQFMFTVAKSLPLVGTGSPEGVVPAPYLSLYIDAGAGQGLISYRKMLADIGGGKKKVGVNSQYLLLHGAVLVAALDLRQT